MNLRGTCAAFCFFVIWMGPHMICCSIVAAALAAASASVAVSTLVARRRLIFAYRRPVPVDEPATFGMAPGDSKVGKHSASAAVSAFIAHCHLILAYHRPALVDEPATSGIAPGGSKPGKRKKTSSNADSRGRETRCVPSRLFFCRPVYCLYGCACPLIFYFAYNIYPVMPARMPPFLLLRRSRNKEKRAYLLLPVLCTSLPLFSTGSLHLLMFYFYFLILFRILSQQSQKEVH